ncbi:NAD(P)H-dependent oxidoreductase [Haloechinothrix sp. YIM 98757]|uniref:NAD(P)H-dependent oxidoreductase n=1 Tax=Haloechinothrix aidingensis TaxID=2752311 RepID=A0A838ADQ7_9PSEU|nr:NAD(P)H-dependent oxidoreductase [Haloechinothrix aidingensis]MBA0127422.1 NAD(P)H-dependent oxidoreductase [Haloechinothrix aidingensis]
MSSSTAPTTTTDRLRIAVIIGSTRPGRAGKPIADWFLTQTRSRTDIEVDMIDLAEAELPAILAGNDDGSLPAEVTAVGERLADADGFVVVTPEYNHAYPAALKNAIDWFYGEWSAKPVAFVSYGGAAKGIRAVEQLRQVFAEVHATTTRDGVSIDLGHTDRLGWPSSPGVDGAAKLMLDQLTWWSRALRTARAEHPYVAAG